jgi:hypothetical protein
LENRILPIWRVPWQVRRLIDVRFLMRIPYVFDPSEAPSLIHPDTQVAADSDWEIFQ